jgi:hypothetical protein
LRAITSTFSIAKKLKKKACIIWVKDERTCGCKFKDLFRRIKGLPVYEVSSKVKKAFYNSERNKYAKFFYRGVGKTIFDEVFGNIKLKSSTKKQIEKKVDKYDRVMFITGVDFYKSKDINRIIKPKKEIKKDIHIEASKIGDKCVGLHIRRGDNIKARRKSPISSFIETIDREKNINKSAKFYLATDSKDVKRMMKKEFGKKIITSSIELSRNSSNGIKDALIDLYCLSETKKIYGSCNSTFAETASMIGNNSLIKVTKNLHKAFTKM